MTELVALSQARVTDSGHCTRCVALYGNTGNVFFARVLVAGGRARGGACLSGGGVDGRGCSWLVASPVAWGKAGAKTSEGWLPVCKAGRPVLG